MRREVAHQANLLQLSLGGHSPLDELLSQSQWSVCGFTGMPNVIRLACMAVQRLLQQEHWSKYRALAFLCGAAPTLRRRSIYIRSLCSLKRLMSQTVEEESRLTFEYAASSPSPLTRLYIEVFGGAGSICYCSRDVRDASAALDSSWAALTFSPPLSHRGVRVLQDWKSPEVTSQVY